jgi:hypothetical protein
MSMTINKQAYEKLIEENIEWLHELTGDREEGILEKGHTIGVLRQSVELLYDYRMVDILDIKSYNKTLMKENDELRKKIKHLENK